MNPTQNRGALIAGALFCSGVPSMSCGTDAPIPIGSYTKTCADISVDHDKDTLSASCQKLGGTSSQLTTLTNLDRCLISITAGGDITNIDGNLICLPNLPLATADMQFPAPETAINGWVYSGDSESIHQHGWEIWAGLSQFVGEVNGVPVRAFET